MFLVINLKEGALKDILPKINIQAGWNKNVLAGKFSKKNRSAGRLLDTRKYAS